MVDQAESGVVVSESFEEQSIVETTSHEPLTNEKFDDWNIAFGISLGSLRSVPTSRVYSVENRLDFFRPQTRTIPCRITRWFANAHEYS